MSTVITISGLPGSGKSTIADAVAEKLKYNRFSSGDFMRELAHERGVTLAELSEIAEDNPNIDRQIDAKNKEFQNAQEVVIDSRLAFHFIPDSFAIFLSVSADEGARRIHDDEQESREIAGDIHASLEEAKESMLERVDSERARYEKLYGLDHTDESQYDLVIDTTDMTPDEITEEVITAYKDWHEA